MPVSDKPPEPHTKATAARLLQELIQLGASNEVIEACRQAGYNATDPGTRYATAAEMDAYLSAIGRTDTQTGCPGCNAVLRSNPHEVSCPNAQPMKDR